MSSCLKNFWVLAGTGVLAVTFACGNRHNDNEATPTKGTTTTKAPAEQGTEIKLHEWIKVDSPKENFNPTNGLLEFITVSGDGKHLLMATSLSQPAMA